MSGPDPGRKRLIDTMTEAALEVDRAAFADWWGHLKEGTIERQAAEAAWRRAYFVAFVAGAGSELLKRGKR